MPDQEDRTLTVRPRPCSTCPYRLDAPPGLWAAEQYDLLPPYDLDTTGQTMAGATSAFHCHSSPELLCAGWVGCHDMSENLGLRLEATVTGARVDPAVYDYQSPVPLFATGAEAAAHGKSALDDPPSKTITKAAALTRLIESRDERTTK